MRIPSKIEEFNKKQAIKFGEFKLITEDIKDDKLDLYLKRVLRKIAYDLEYIKQSIQEDDDEELLILKWKFVSMIIDRLFFYIIIIYLIITFSGIILSSSNFYKLQ